MRLPGRGGVERVRGEPVGGVLTSYLAAFQLLSPCLALELADAERVAERGCVRRVEIVSGGRRGSALIVAAPSARAVSELRSFAFECGSMFPAEAFLRSVAELRAVVSRYPRVLVLLAYVPIPTTLFPRPRGGCRRFEPVPPPSVVDECVPVVGDVRVCSATGRRMDVLVTAADERFVHVAYAAAVVKTMPMPRRVEPFAPEGV